jgi:serine/threonine-protein kinase
LSDLLSRFQASLAGRYRIERELGRGGMAMVFLAHDLKHDRPVALKVLRPELAQVLGSDRFLREIRLCARLQHPHILAVHDSGDADGQLWFSMPYVDGETLRGRMLREKQLPVDDALRIAREVADALHYAHEHGVIHRDIKPENILLTGASTGQGGASAGYHALVADFGIARALSSEPDERLTETGFSLGTPHYMSPEQAVAQRDIDPRTDIYSLGCVLYEMLTGEPPYTGPSPQAILAKRLSEPRGSPRP